MSIHVDPKKLVVAQQLRSKGMTNVSVAEALGVSEATASRWSRGLTNDPVKLEASEPNCGLQPYWGDATDWGWERYSPKDSHETEYADDGRLVKERRVFDPGVVYPPDWKYAKIQSIPKIEQRGDGVTRFLLTGAQDKTPVHGPFATNLVRYAQHIGAEIIVGSATYARDWFNAIFGGTGRSSRNDRSSLQVLGWSSALSDVLTSKRRELSSSIAYCAEVNILPTARNPLSDLGTYNRGNSAVFTHPRQDLQSVPRNPADDPVLIMGTGYCTTPNYVDKKAGKVAEFHHIIGAILIEIDADGYVYPTRIHADARNGSFYCYDLRVVNNRVLGGQRAAALVYADAHVEQMDASVAAATWGYGTKDKASSLQRWLRPRAEVFHDTLDFWSKSHHNAADPWHGFEVKTKGVTVTDEIRRAVSFVRSVRYRPAKTLIAESNHDLAFGKWLRETDWRTDPTNAPLYLDANLWALAEIRRRPESVPAVYEYAARRLFGDRISRLRFLRQSDSHVVAGVEIAPHGHQGPNGSRGTHRNGIKTARRQVSGHEHSPACREGYVTVGTCHRFKPMPKYARGGASGWAHAHGVIYASGKSALIFVHAGRARASGRKRFT